MRYDYLIIGAGVIGSATAFHLIQSEPNARILLVDQGRRVGTGNTAKSAALYRNIFSSTVSRDLATSSISYYETLGDRIQLDPFGYLWLFSESQWKNSSETRDRLDPKRDRLEFLDREEIDGMVMVGNSTSKTNNEQQVHFPKIEMGIFGHMCGALSGMGLAEHYVNGFREAGGEVNFGTKVTGFELTGMASGYAPWEDIEISGARTIGENDRIIQADHYISTTGAWTQDLLSPVGIASNIYPKKRQLFGLKVGKEGLYRSSTGGMHGGGMHGGRIHGRGMQGNPAVILPAGGVYLKPITGKDFIMVGCADDLGQPYSREYPYPDPAYFRNAIEPVLNHYFPSMGTYTQTTKWAGHYAYHWPDKNPVVETVSNLTWVSGTSGSGIMKADALGRIAQGHVRGKSEVGLADGRPFTVSRLTLRDRNVENEGFII